MEMLETMPSEYLGTFCTQSSVITVSKDGSNWILNMVLV